MLSRCFLDFSLGVGAFVIGLSQISTFFSFYEYLSNILSITLGTHCRKAFCAYHLLENVHASPPIDYSTKTKLYILFSK